MKNMRSTILVFAGLSFSCVACAAAGPSQELKTARDAYAKASENGAAQGNPASTRDAQQALAAAERAHRDDAGSEKERSYAYVAQRKSELALAQAEEARAREEHELADRAYQAKLEQQLADAQRDLQAQRDASEKAENQLVSWRKRGDDLVVTLSGILFEKGRHELSSEAKKRLDVVVHTVKQNPERSITIAGYTDSSGRAETNRTLSQKRAEQVKSYLESKGIAASRIVSEGHGESDAIASNETAEGRAENRRVEITLRPPGELPERQPVKGTDPEPMPLSQPR